MHDPSDVRALALRTLMPGFDGAAVPAWLDDALREGLGAVCLYGANVVDRDQLRSLCADLHARSPRVVVALDEEGGDVTRLHYRTGSPYPGNGVLGRLDDVGLTAAAAAAIGRDLRDVGVDLDLGPVVDVNSAPDNPVIGTRSFGADAGLVSRHAAAWVQGLRSTGTAACAKHFPGHGDTATDSHLDLPVLAVDAATLRERELAPFRAAVGAGAEAVMTAALVVPSVDPGVPATFSAPLVQGVLRGELGFTGTVVTDALDMAGASAATGIPEAAVRALAAGCDLLCLGPGTGARLLEEVLDAVVAAVAAGRIPAERLREAAAAVDRLADRERHAAGRDGALPAVPVVDAFEVGEHARTWLAGGGAVAIVQVSTSSNLAVGQVPWGPEAVGAADDEAGAATAPRVAVVARDLGPDHPAWQVAARHRARGASVVVVECGWPRGGADLVTWGGSPAVAGPLVALLRGTGAAS
ncbi:MAG: hypothetical protein GC157_04960 [Frankiales bacterium]|nr:hypothetical protein [Frankiales bacterium]